MWGSGLGCDGIVEVLLESLAGEALMRFLSAHLEQRARGVIATIFRAGVSETEEAAAHKGARVMLEADGELIGGHSICHALVEDLHATINTADLSARGVSCTRSYGTPRGEVEAFIESIEPPAALVIFGAGADAVPVARLAHDTGMHVTVIDHRPAYATVEGFPAADQIIVCRPEAVTREVTLEAHIVAVVMTHSYEHDRELLKTLVASQARYIGMLGPKRRTERMLVELLSDEAFEFDDGDLTRLHAPVGLDIGAETPEGIAVSIIAEVRAVLAGRAGGSLRELSGSIHEQTSEVPNHRRRADQHYVNA